MGRIMYGSQMYTKTRKMPVVETASDGPPNDRQAQIALQKRRPRAASRVNHETMPSCARISFQE